MLSSMEKIESFLRPKIWINKSFFLKPLTQFGRNLLIELLLSTALLLHPFLKKMRLIGWGAKFGSRVSRLKHYIAILSKSLGCYLRIKPALQTSNYFPFEGKNVKFFSLNGYAFTTRFTDLGYLFSGEGTCWSHVILYRGKVEYSTWWVMFLVFLSELNKR